MTSRREGTDRFPALQTLGTVLSIDTDTFTLVAEGRPPVQGLPGDMVVEGRPVGLVTGVQ